MFFTVPNRGGYFLIPDEGFLSAPTAYNPMVRISFLTYGKT